MMLQQFRKPAFLAALTVATALGLAVAGQRPALALVEVNISGGKVQPLPIAIPVFQGAAQDAQMGSQIAGVISADLKRSGLFIPLDPATFTQANMSADATPQFANWTAISAQALVAGTVSHQPDGRLKAEFRLWDTFAGQQMDGQQFFTQPQNWRRLAHIIADAVYTRLTGEKGYFDSRVVFVDESGPKDNRIRRLAIMDQDGANVRDLTDGKFMELSPRFSPSSQEITYMSYDNDQPSVYVLNIDTGQREPVGDFPGMTSAPRFSPDGQKVIVSLSTGRDTNLFTLDLRSRQATRLTNDAAIDTSGCYSPDGSQIVFASNRGGPPQLYIMNADGSNPHRISFGNGQYTTPVWSPRGDLIAFTLQSGPNFGIGVMKPDGSGERILTQSTAVQEGPTWAPNGRVLMFERDTQGATGGPQLWTIDLSGYGETQVPTPNFASDAAWSPLLN